jgi:hypothetical protein
MGGYSEGDPHDLISALIDELDLHPACDQQVRQVVKGDPERTYGCLERQDYSNPNCDYNLSVYFLDWRKATWDEKSILRNLDQTANLQSKQVSMTRQLRENFVTDVTSDVILYLGEHGEQIRYPFKQAVRWLYNDSKDLENHEIIITCFSLGSQMLLDALM